MTLFYYPLSEGSLHSNVTILSYSRYCRYRATLKRLEHVSDDHVRVKLIETLSGFVASQPNTRIMFAKETIDFPDILESHELLCPHLAPKLKGKPRGRRKKLLSRISECSSPAPSSEFSVDSCETNDSDVFQGKHLVGISRYFVLQSQAQHIFSDQEPRQSKFQPATHAQQEKVRIYAFGSLHNAIHRSRLEATNAAHATKVRHK